VSFATQGHRSRSASDPRQIRVRSASDPRQIHALARRAHPDEDAQRRQPRVPRSLPRAERQRAFATVPTQTRRGSLRGDDRSAGRDRRLRRPERREAHLLAVVGAVVAYRSGVAARVDESSRRRHVQEPPPAPIRERPAEPHRASRHSRVGGGVDRERARAGVGAEVSSGVGHAKQTSRKTSRTCIRKCCADLAGASRQELRTGFTNCYRLARSAKRNGPRSGAGVERFIVTSVRARPRTCTDERRRAAGRRSCRPFGCVGESARVVPAGQPIEET